MAHSLAEAEVHTVVMLAVNGLIDTNAPQSRQRRVRRCKRRIEWAIAALGVNRLRRVRHFLIDVDGLVPVQAEHVRVLDFERGVCIQRPAIAGIEFLGHWVPIVGGHQAAYATRVKLRGRSRNRGHGVHAIAPLAQWFAGSRYDVIFGVCEVE